MNAQIQTSTEVREILLADLQPDPKQPRKYFDKKALQELANDIASRGIIEPVIIFIGDDGKNTIFAGERRYRAAQLAELETVPCLLRAPGTDMERLLDQVSENFQREGLNPIEMAMFFDALIKDHDIKPTELPAFLVKYGFKKFDRSYISNIRRLLQLPKWAKTMIQKDHITAAHGKYLLQGIASTLVMKHLQTFLKKSCTTSRLRTEIEEAYDQLHIDVGRGKKYFDEEYGVDRYRSTKFDWKKDCLKCETCQILNTEYSTTLYCLNEPCYDEKQLAAAIKIEKAEQRKQRAAETRRKKELEKQAQEKGITVEELEAEDLDEQYKDDPRANARKERTQAYLDDWLRTQLKDYLLDDRPEIRYAILLWVAADKPNGMHSWGASWNDQWDDVDLSNLRETWGEVNLTHFLQTTLSHTETLDAILKNAIQGMSRTNLRTLSHYCQIQLEGNYTIDRDYLDIKIKSEIIESTPASVIDAWDEGHWEKLCNKDLAFLKDNILNMDHHYGIPADLNEMYNGDQ